jgi:prepilin-type processing-associated H-X9-DG protein
MERSFNRQTSRAWTLIELLVVIAVLFILAAMIDWGPTTKAKAKAQRIYCVNNLKQVTLSFRVWQEDHQGRFPMAVGVTNGGTLEWVEGGNALKHLLVISNELAFPKVLTCPSDKRIAATNFTDLKNENLSCFVGLDANTAEPQMFLVGDRNITNGLIPRRTVLTLPPDRPAGWTDAMHVKQGNVGWADGSVHSFATLNLQEALKHTDDATNRIALPE